jgi:hypothetical protein
VGSGAARLTFSFPAWSIARVTPKTIEIAWKPATATSVIAADPATPAGRRSFPAWLICAGVGAAGAVLFAILVLFFNRRPHRGIG